ncbi:hypothetical protein ACVWXU_008518 [Streptomyces sp. TE33382]
MSKTAHHHHHHHRHRDRRPGARMTTWRPRNCPERSVPSLRPVLVRAPTGIRNGRRYGFDTLAAPGGAAAPRVPAFFGPMAAGAGACFPGDGAVGGEGASASRRDGAVPRGEGRLGPVRFSRARSPRSQTRRPLACEAGGDVRGAGVDPLHGPDADRTGPQGGRARESSWWLRVVPDGNTPTRSFIVAQCRPAPGGNIARRWVPDRTPRELDGNRRHIGGRRLHSAGAARCRLRLERAQLGRLVAPVAGAPDSTPAGLRRAHL